ncbi:hypothetical protein GBA52_002654 [Prunus armeniaca]|nr:hypothetical protein GBA52_002654 [Prunus armeniaca]
MAGSKRRLSSSKGLGGVLREQRARLYIIRSRIKASKEKTKARRHRTLLQHKRVRFQVHIVLRRKALARSCLLINKHLEPQK